MLPLDDDNNNKDCLSLSEPDDSIYCDEFDWSAFSPDRENVDELCDASEDYAKNPKNCDKAYDLVEKAEKKYEDEDEGKRYENPDGGAPLYEDELTEDEKDEYKELKPDNVDKKIKELTEETEQESYQKQMEYQQEKYRQLTDDDTEIQMEDWKNTVEVDDEPEQDEEEDSEEQEEEDDSGGEESEE